MQRRKFIRQSTLAGSCLSSYPSLLQQIKTGKNQPEKWSREASFYTLTARGVKCDLCPNTCILTENEMGDCHNRINIGNKLYSIAYGNPCAVNIDPVEKKPLYHFLPGSTAFSIGTAGCNLACMNCQNWQISQRSPRDTRNSDLMPAAVIEQARAGRCRSVAYTYNEPLTFFEYAYDTSVIARKSSIKNILVTNGYINEKPLRRISTVTDAANVDLKSFDNNVYMQLNGGTLDPVLRTLKIMKEAGVWLEITNLLVPGYTDRLDMIRQMCAWLASNGFADTPLFFSRFFPAYKLSGLKPTPPETIYKAREIAINEGLNFVYTGNLDGVEGDNTNCPGCKKLLIRRDGFKVLSNVLLAGRCPVCNTVIPGVWG